MKILSLFDGIACGRVALERVGIKVDEYVAYEIDKYAIQVATNNYPDIIEMGSVIDADFARYKGFDLLIGGSPCQSLSITTSNKRQNLDAKCQTLTCCAGGNLQKKVLINNRVRKLTPLEYERLQTLPDNYTEGISNSQRYNCIGNGWTVDVIAWIFSFIPKEDNND